MAKESERGISFLSESEQTEYISLKEAALLTDYSPDYIGQLIRAGKIEGKQVYSNVSWVTTEKAIRAYVALHHKGDASVGVGSKKDPSIYLRYLLYGVIACLGFILLVCTYIFFVGIDRTLTDVSTKESTIEGYE